MLLIINAQRVCGGGHLGHRQKEKINLRQKIKREEQCE